jgi:hypothetical protein
MARTGGNLQTVDFPVQAIQDGTARPQMRGSEMAEDDEISSREANLRSVLGKVGLALRRSGGGYQVVDASTLKAVAGAQGPNGYSMSLKDAEDYAVMAFWAQGKAGRQEQLPRAVEIAGWDPTSPHRSLPEGTGIVLSDPPPPELQRRYLAVETNGPRAKTVLDTVTLREHLLEKCEHLSGDEDLVFWISTRPSRGLCGACWEAAQAADEQYCAFCDGPANDPAWDTAIGTKATNKLGVLFFLCSHCVDLDRADGGTL